ncbi:hypothetical protein [Desulfobulbus oligotrophicus]|jgi:hypothetical protein|uniref:Tryptophan synthase subunit beta like protein n=1 Tax=Desulfobulbus oligotrophicus TaxID=1909699 RepID=A0A7T5VAN9_9BACT|nr:hypothetical protein [Desulfobulbus oligotrophicus]MDY0391550.1 hypothetical protein [Desulfobulbus oligotrophicus]QQG64396.1 hypothetical protein HP555_00235 [Desulfobulbus oligotrophicus]
MLFVERDETGNIVALRKGESGAGKEPVSLLDAEILSFLRTIDDFESFSHLLAASDASMVRVVEDLIDLLIAKKVILFTELPSEAQEKILNRKQLRAKMSDHHLVVDDII